MHIIKVLPVKFIVTASICKILFSSIIAFFSFFDLAGTKKSVCLVSLSSYLKFQLKRRSTYWKEGTYSGGGGGACK